MSDQNIEYFAIAWVSSILVGILLGMRQTIVVFRNYNDLTLVFAAAVMTGIGIFLSLSDEGDGSNLQLYFCGIAVALDLWVVARTLRDNHNPFWMVLALITKLSLSALFLTNLVDFVTPSGNTAKARAASRRGAFVVLLLIAPITFALIKDKTGIFNPRSALGNRF